MSDLLPTVWITWQPNKQEGGVMTRSDDGTIIFPSRVGFKSPDGGGKTREVLPYEGECELVRLYPSSSGTTLFAYPAIIRPTAIRGVVDVEGNIIILRLDGSPVTVERDGDKLVITIG